MRHERVILRQRLSSINMLKMVYAMIAVASIIGYSAQTLSDDIYGLCDIRLIDGVEYSHGCDLDLHDWHDTPIGSLPTVCYDECNAECIPDDWVRYEVMRRRTVCL